MTVPPVPAEHVARRPATAAVERLQVLTVPAVVTVVTDTGLDTGAHGDERRLGLLLARRGTRAFVAVRRGWGDNVLRWLPAAAVETSAGDDQQALRPDPERTSGVGQHTGREPRAAR